MNYAEERTGELEALESIYFQDFSLLEEGPLSKFKIDIKSENYDQEPEDGMCCSLVFTYTPKYPDEPPEIEIDEAENLDDEHIEQLTKCLLEQANENLGMVMVFTLVSAGHEWLNSKSDQLRTEKEEGLLKKKKAEEEAEQKRFEGTRVSVETFLVWKNGFEIETGVAAKREKDLKDSKKLTGKELFLRDTTLNESDLKFLDDGDAVKVDESLFQNLDDIDLSDDDDDEDYVPGQSESD